MTGSKIARAALVALAVVAAAPAWAGRGTQIDELYYLDEPCTLGATTCRGFDISSIGPFRTAYLYREGIVSIDAMLPVGATADDPVSLGSGIWFAPGLSSSANYYGGIYRRVSGDDEPGAWGFNFYTRQYDEEDGEFYFIEPDEFTEPTFQALITSGTFQFRDPDDPRSGWDGVYAELGYGFAPTDRPAANALIGFSWGPGQSMTVRNADGLLVGPREGDTDFVSVRPASGAPTFFTPLYAEGAVPEPATWAMLVAGFGLAGAALRRRPYPGQAAATL